MTPARPIPRGAILSVTEPSPGAGSKAPLAERNFAVLRSRSRNILPVGTVRRTGARQRGSPTGPASLKSDADRHLRGICPVDWPPRRLFGRLQ